MVSLGQIQKGLTRFVDTDMLPMLTGWQKWGFGTIAGLSLSKISNIFNSIKGNSFIATLGVVDANDMVDIDTIYKEVHKVAQQGPMTIDVPMLGALTLNAQDVEKLYRYIRES